MIDGQAPYGLSAQTRKSPAEAADCVREALARQGLEIMGEWRLPVAGDSGEAYWLFAAGDTTLLGQAVAAEADVGLLLPPKVVIHSREGTTTVALTDPVTVLALANNPSVTTVGWELRRRLELVRDEIRQKLSD